MRLIVSLGLVAALSAAPLIAGCAQEKASSGSAQTDTSGKTTQLQKVRVAYYGGTCEAPIYVAEQKDIFRNNGLDVETVKVDFDTLKEGLATGKIDAVQITAGELKAIEQGLNIKVTRGVHTGCIQAVAPVLSRIKGVKDLSGKRIGVEAIGGVPMTLLSIELGRVGLDFKKDVEWKAYPAPQLAQALDKGEIDAFTTWDPFGQQAIDGGNARRIFSNTYDPAYKDQFCCFVGLNGDVAEKSPRVAEAITKSIEEAASQIEADPAEAAHMAIENEYTSGDETTTAYLLDEYGFGVSGDKTRDSLSFWLQNMKQQGILESGTDPAKLLDAIYVAQP